LIFFSELVLSASLASISSSLRSCGAFSSRSPRRNRHFPWRINSSYRKYD